MKKHIKEKLLKAADVLEIFIGILLILIISISSILLISKLKLFILNSNDIDFFTTYLNTIFQLVILIEFVKMLCKHTPATVIEVILFSIAKQIITEHGTALENLVGILSIAAIFAIRKYLFYNFDEVEKDLYKSSERVKKINLLEHISIPYDEDETLESVILKEIDKRELKLEQGICIYYSGFALKIAKIKNDSVDKVEVIKI